MIFSADTNNPMHQLMFTMLSGFAQFERELIRERQREGIAIARAENKYQGRKKTIDDAAIRAAMVKPDASYRKVAKELGVSLSTVQRAMKGG